MIKRISFIFIALLFVAGVVFAEKATVSNSSNRHPTASAIVFNGISSTGASNTFDLTFASDDYAWTIVPSGSPSVVNVQLQCTQDGINYLKMDNYSTTSPENEYRSVNNKTCSQLRGNILGIAGGAVTVILQAK